MRKMLFWFKLILIFGVWLYIFHQHFGRMDVDAVLMSILCSIGTLMILAAIKQLIWRHENGVDLFATLETDPERLKLKLYLKMLQCDAISFPNVLNEITGSFHNYPQWNIPESEMFKSWYKHNIDYMLRYPMHYDLSWLANGDTYIKEHDSLYDIHARPWEETDWTNIPLTS